MVTFVNLFLVAIRYGDRILRCVFKMQQHDRYDVNGLIQGCLPIMRFNYGAGNRVGLHSALRYGTALVSGMMILGTLTRHPLSGAAFGIIYSVGSHALLWNIRYANYGGKLSVLRFLYHDSTYFQATEQVLSKYADPATASVSAAHSIHVGSGKTPEDYRDLAVLPCHRNGNIRSGASDLPSRQKKKYALQRYKNTVKNRKRRERIWKYILKKGLDALQTEHVLRLLSQTVWACNRKKEAIMESWKHSICYGAYTADGKQIGFARVITDYATQYYICDVVVDADFRHRGVGPLSLKAITAEDTYRSLLGMLITEEAEQFYEPFASEKIRSVL